MSERATIISPWDLFIAVWTVIGMASAEELKS